MGVARVIGAVMFSVVIGLIMSLIYRKEEMQKKEDQMHITAVPEKRPMWQTMTHFFTLVLILVFANWEPRLQVKNSGAWHLIWTYKCTLPAFSAWCLHGH
jgi:uncharacterized membrane protein YraQ (UPF0718 family)